MELLGLTFETEIDHGRVSASTGAVASYTVTADIDAPENAPGMQAIDYPRLHAGGAQFSGASMSAVTVDLRYRACGRRRRGPHGRFPSQRSAPGNHRHLAPLTGPRRCARRIRPRW